MMISIYGVQPTQSVVKRYITVKYTLKWTIKTEIHYY